MTHATVSESTSGRFVPVEHGSDRRDDSVLVPDPASPGIRTVSGAGYRWLARPDR